MQHTIEKAVVQRFLSCLFLLSLVLDPAAAQSREVPPQEGEASEQTFYDTVDVNVVNVEVFVTDAQGRRVTGLTRDDFQVLEDGKPVAITNFYAAESFAAAPASRRSTSLHEQELQLAVFVDMTNLSQTGGRRLQKSLEEFLASRAGERVLLASYRGSQRLAVRPVDTADRQAVTAALSEVFADLPAVPQRLMHIRQLLRSIQLGKDIYYTKGREDVGELTLDAARIGGDLDAYAMKARHEAELSVEILDHFLNGLASLPGRKAVLYVGGGMPIYADEAMVNSYRKKYCFEEDSVEQRIDARAQADLQAFRRKVEERANANRITIYSLGEAENVAPSFAANPYGIWGRREEETERSGLARSLDDMALPTGGLADLNTLDPGALLEQMRQDLDSYYSLGYTLASRRPGTTHRLEVKVKRPGLTVRHRQSYHDRSPAQLLAERTISALYFGPMGNPLELALRLEAEGEAEAGQQRVKLALKLPFSKLVVLPQGNVHQGRLEVAVAVRDQAGRASQVTTFEVPVRIPNDRLQEMFGQTVGYETRLALRPLEHVVAVSVRDGLGNLASTVTTTWEPVAGGTPVGETARSSTR